MTEDMREIALWYAEARLGRAPDPRRRTSLSPEEVLQLLWEFHPLFTPRSDAFSATPYAEAFMSEADTALVWLARTDDFASWDGLSAGAWRVLAERLSYLEAIVARAWLEGAKVFTSVPRGLDRRSKGRFVLLLLLLGEARTIPPSLLERSGSGAFPGFPEMPLRRH